MVFQPFVISDFITGLERDGEPWRLPKDAFSKFTNARTKRGAIEKRDGYTLWKTIAGDLAIMGLFSFYDAGVEKLVAFTTKRLWVYNTGTSVFDDKSGADDWSSGATDYFWVANWSVGGADRLFIVNNKEALFDYDTATGTNLVTVDYGAGAVVMLSKMVFVYKGHLLVLNVTEDGVLYSKRARWSSPNDPDDWTNDGYVDCPTDGAIVTAGFVGDDLIVWFEYSVYRLKYTQNVDLPFRWERINSFEGSFSTFSATPYLNELMAVGRAEVLLTDAIDIVGINEKIPDIVLEMNPNSLATVYSVVNRTEEQILISYPSGTNTANDKTLALNYKDNSWSEYDYGFVCFGLFTEQTTLTLDDIVDAWDDISLSWDDYISKRAGYRTLLAGDASGNIFKLNDGNSDNTAAIAFEMESARWNPFLEKGKKAKLGWIDFFIDKNSVTSLTVDFYVNNESVPYQSLTLDATGLDSEDKVWKRLDSGAIGNFHRININHTEAGQKVRMYAIIPWFESSSGIFE